MSKDSFKIGEWLVEPSLDRISRGGDVTGLRPQVMAVLVYLADRPGELVSPDDLMRDVWGGRVVTEGSIYNCISELRTAFATAADAVVETIPRKGYRLVAPVTPYVPETVRSWTRRRVALAVGLSFAAIAATVVFFWNQSTRTDHGDIRSLAVLPLDNHSADPARDEYFADGMTEVIIAKLSQVRGLKVISRTSAMRLKDSELSIPEIADLLGVDGIVEGSVLTAGNEVRITLQLIDGTTDFHFWSNTYVGSLGDVLGLQNKIANSIAAELSLQLTSTPGDALLASRSLTDSPDAYRAYLQGRYFFHRFGAENFIRALAHYEEATDLDPDFALAYASLAEACTQPLILGGGIRTLGQCEADARKAVSLNENLAEAHAALGYIHFVRWEWQQAEASLQRALELNPASVMARQWYAVVLRATYRFDEALGEIRKAEELDPLNLFVRTMVAWPLYDMGDYNAALAQLQDVLELDPDFMLAHYNQGLAYIGLRLPDQVAEAAERVARIAGADSFESRLLFASAHAIGGDREAAMEILRSVEQDGGNFFAAWIAHVYLLMGDEEGALARLEQGVRDRALDLLTIAEPKFDSIRDHPRFLAVSREVGLHVYR